MKTGTILIVCLLAFTAALGMAEDNTINREVPVAVLDSIEANNWRLKRDIVRSFRTRIIENELDKHGEIINSDTEYMLVKLKDGEKLATIHTDEFGVPIPEEESKNKREEKGSANPFSMFKKENRMNYRFTILEPDSFGRMRIKSEALKDMEDGFEGITTIDTLYWVPVIVEGGPSKFPKMVKELSMVMELGPSEKGHFQINKIDTYVMGKFLLMTFRMQMNSSFYDYQFIDEQE